MLYSIFTQREFSTILNNHKGKSSDVYFIVCTQDIKISVYK